MLENSARSHFDAVPACRDDTRKIFRMLSEICARADGGSLHHRRRFPTRPCPRSPPSCPTWKHSRTLRLFPLAALRQTTGKNLCPGGAYRLNRRRQVTSRLAATITATDAQTGVLSPRTSPTSHTGPVITKYNGHAPEFIEGSLSKRNVVIFEPVTSL